MKGPLAKNQLVGGRYSVTDWIGAGGMQNVYAATDTFFGRPVALKVPKEDAAVRRFKKSAVVSARVNHSNVAKTLDYFEGDERAYLVEEIVEGLDLSKVVPKLLPYVPPQTASRVFHQLAKGLAASHHVGVIHRDLKPSNIMLVGGLEFIEAKITDFGIATMAEGEIGPWAEGEDKGTQSRTILGAIPYMAPESIRAFKTSGKPADVYSIAAIVYELIAGTPPFGRGPASIAEILGTKAPAKPAYILAAQFKGCGDELFAVLLQCLSRDPALRPTADELVKLCATICYSEDKYFIGTISNRANSVRGFISADKGRDLMYHTDSFYGLSSHGVGNRLWFGRHPGGNNDRAFPIVKMVQEKPPS